MSLKTTSAYITTINPDHTVVLPPEMPVGATIAVIVMPETVVGADDMARHTRFEATLSAIRAASAAQPIVISDEKLDILIEQARKASNFL